MAEIVIKMELLVEILTSSLTHGFTHELIGSPYIVLGEQKKSSRAKVFIGMLRARKGKPVEYG